VRPGRPLDKGTKHEKAIGAIWMVVVHGGNHAMDDPNCPGRRHTGYAGGCRVVSRMLSLHSRI